MIAWIKVIFSLSDSIDNACNAIDNQLESAALLGLLQTGERAYDNIVSLLDRKNLLQRLKLIKDSMLTNLTQEELEHIDQTASTISKPDLSHVTSRYVLRSPRILDKLERHLKALGYTSQVLEQDYSSIDFVIDSYRKINKDKTIKQTKLKKN